MASEVTERTRAILATAQREARRMQHGYVGTEHLLLGLMEDGAGVAFDVLETFGVTPERVRREVDRLVQSGPLDVAAGGSALAGSASAAAQLPLTPRARRAMSLAGEEAMFVGQKQVDSEHLLLGLLREPEGVAVRVLQNLGLTVQQVWAEAFKTRVELMKIVERSMRPVRATVIWKRKRREEMLAHLTEIFDEEYALSHDAASALAEASRRFGEPAELARELDHSVSWPERLSYRVEQGFAWRAPESLARYAWRLAWRTVLLLAVLLGVDLVLALVVIGWNTDQWNLVRVFASVIAIAPPTVFAVTWLSIKLRDAMWGAFGSTRSWRRVTGLSFLLSAVGLAFTAAFTVLANPAPNAPFQTWPSCLAAAVVLPLISLIAARRQGRTEIADAMWALLDVNRGDAELREAT